MRLNRDRADFNLEGDKDSAVNRLAMLYDGFKPHLGSAMERFVG
jgi:hypothetical protein